MQSCLSLARLRARWGGRRPPNNTLLFHHHHPHVVDLGSGVVTGTVTLKVAAGRLSGPAVKTKTLGSLTLLIAFINVTLGWALGSWALHQTGHCHTDGDGNRNGDVPSSSRRRMSEQNKTQTTVTVTVTVAVTLLTTPMQVSYNYLGHLEKHCIFRTHRIT